MGPPPNVRFHTTPCSSFTCRASSIKRRPRTIDGQHAEVTESCAPRKPRPSASSEGRGFARRARK
eukprot:7282805-Pyramimonas_sp.AAC.1